MTEKKIDFSQWGFLIVDDKAFLRGIVQSMLVSYRARSIKHASNGAEAIRVLAQDPSSIDCVLCDWNMEPMDGLEFLRAVRSGSASFTTRRDLRVIMLTGYAEADVVKAALSMNANGYVVKPVSSEKLIHAIENAFSKPTKLRPPEAYKSSAKIELPRGQYAPDKSQSPQLALNGMADHERREFKKSLASALQQTRTATAASDKTTSPQSTNKRLDLTAVTPGMVLEEDIYTDDNRLLLPRGTALSKPVLDCLKSQVAGKSGKMMIAVGQGGD